MCSSTRLVAIDFILCQWALDVVRSAGFLTCISATAVALLGGVALAFGESVAAGEHEVEGGDGGGDCV